MRRARSTIWKALPRRGLSRRPRGERQTDRGYEWSRPGALLHMDLKKLGRFDAPGGGRWGCRATRPARAAPLGHLDVVIDDHSRLA
jgi:hypothetical protein